MHRERDSNSKDFSKRKSDRYPLQDLGAAVERAVTPGPETYKILIYL